MKPAGERPPYTALLILTALIASYLLTPTPKPLSAAEVLRDGPSPKAPWRRPDVETLLAGRDCIPLRILLENRELEPIHSYSREIHCPGGTR